MATIRESFRDAQDMRTKLCRGVCQIDGQWVVTGDLGDQGLQYFNDPLKVHNLPYDAQMNRMNINKFNLGMVNGENGVYFVTRNHMRQWTQVLNSGNTETVSLNPAIPPPRIDTLLLKATLKDTLDNNFPLVWTAWEGVARDIHPDKWLGKAFHRDFAFVRSGLNTISLMYRTMVVGEFQIDRNNRRTITKLDLYPSFEYLYERLRAVNIPVERANAA